MTDLVTSPSTCVLLMVVSIVVNSLLWKGLLFSPSHTVEILVLVF